jgi:hypothetical protein
MTERHHLRRTPRAPARRSNERSTASLQPGPFRRIHTLQRVVGNAAVARVLGPSDGRRLARETRTVKTTFDDCPKNAKDVIRERTQTAAAWVDYTLRQLDAVLANPSKADPDLHALFRKHFHLGEGTRATRALQDTAAIRARFARIYGAFAGKVSFECESSCDPRVQGYVNDYWIFGTGDIHVCPPFFALGYQDQVATIIHEMAHKYAGVSDRAYVWQAKYRTLSTEAAIDNADSYAEFAKDI